MKEREALLIDDIRMNNTVVVCSFDNQRISKESTEYFCV